MEEKKYVQMSPDTVKAIGESVNISNVGVGVCRALSEDVSFRVRQLAHISAQFSAHAKRKKLTTADVKMASRWFDAQPTFGFNADDDDDEDAKSAEMSYVAEAGVYVVNQRQVDLKRLAQ